MKRFPRPRKPQSTYAIVQAKTSCLHRHGAGRLAGAPLHDGHAGPASHSCRNSSAWATTRRCPRRLQRRARRPLHRPAHAHQQGDILTTAILSHGDTTPHVFSVLAGRVFLHGNPSLRPGRALPDPGLRHDRSRPGMNNWMANAFSTPNNPSAAARCCPPKISRSWRFRSLPGFGWRWRRLSHASRHQSPAGPTLRAAAATTTRPVQRARERLHR